jgi:hypothetical protein
MAKYAKKRAHKKTHHRRRRSVGAMSLSSSGSLIKFGSIAAGYFLADKINDPIDTAVGTKLDHKIIGVAQGGLGYLLAFKGKTSMIKSVAGGVLIGSGLKRMLKEFGVISGFRSVPVLGNRRIKGFRDVPVIGVGPSALNGYNVPGVVAGYNVPGRAPKTMNGVYTGASDNGTRSNSGVNDNDR